MDHLIDLVASTIVFLGGLVFEFIAFIDGLLASLMLSAGIPPNIQLIILIVVAVLIMAYAIRGLGPLFVGLLLVLLLLLVLHKAFPDLHPPNIDINAPGGTIHT